MDSLKTYTRLQRTDFYGPASFLFFSIGRLLDITYWAIMYPRLLRTSIPARKPANAPLTTDFTMDQPANTAWSVSHWVGEGN